MPDVSLDSLQIEIGAKATSANHAIDNLIGKLDRLTTSIGGLGKTNFTGFAVSIKNISSAMQGLSSVKLPDYTRLAKGIDKFSTINSEQIRNAGLAMQELGKSLRMIDKVDVSDNAVQLVQLAKGISQLGYKSATQAVDNIPKLATAMRDLMTTLAGAPQVSQSLIDMTNALAKLARTGSSSGRASTSLARSLDLYSASSNRARKSTWSLASAFGKMYASYWLVFRAFRQIGKAIDISSDLTEIQNVVDVTFGDMTYKVEEFAETSIEKFGMSELTLKRTASQFQAMGSAMNINSKNIASANQYLNKQTDGYIGLGNSMADVSLNLTKLTADMSSFYNLEQDMVAEDLQSIFTGQTKPLRQYGIDLTEVNLKQWAMNEGLNSNIESMTQAEKVMLRYQYVLAHTNDAQGDFARTSQTWANQIRILKQSFEQLGAIIGGTFINMLKPLVRALNTAMSSIISFAQTISNALGKIFGWKFEVGNGGVATDLEDGAGYADEIADGMGSAVDSAKRLNQQLQGFDRLNVLRTQENTNNNGGSGSGAGDTVGAIGGEWIKGETIFEDYKSEIDSLFELGDYISQTLSRAMESIDWEKIYEKAKGFGKGLADFLNGLISPRLFGNLGKTIANSLNTALYSLNSFGKEFDFYEFGKSIASGINDFFDNFDFELLADTLNTWVDGLKEFIRGFVNDITWDSIIEGAKDFLGDLEVDTIEVIIGGFALKYIGQNLTANVFKKAINTRLNSLVIMAFKTGAILPLTVVLDLTFKTAKTESAEEFLDSLEKFNNFEFSTMEFKDWVNVLEEFLLVATTGGISGSYTAKQNILIDLMKSIPQKSDYETLAEYNNALKEWQDIYDETSEQLYGYKPYEHMKEWDDSINNIKTSFNSLKDKFIEVKTDISTGASLMFLGIIDGAQDFVNDTKEKWNEWKNTIQTKLTEVKQKIKDWYNNTIKKWFSKENWKFSGIKDGLSEAFDSALNSLKELWNGFKEWLSGKLSLDLELEIPEWLQDAKDAIFSKGNKNEAKYVPNSVSTQSLSTAKGYSGYANSVVSSYGSGNYNLENAVEVAVSRVLVPYLADIANSNREVANKEFGITERAIGKAVQNQNRISVKRTGKTLLAT